MTNALSKFEKIIHDPKEKKEKKGKKLEEMTLNIESNSSKKN